jgi:hypothetical protein
MSYLNRAINLWYSDVERRRRFQVLTILIAFAYGVLNSLALDRPEKQVTWETLGVILFLTVAFTAYYCVRTEAPMVRTEFVRLREMFENRRVLEVGLVSVILLAIASFVVYVPNERVQAASLDLRLGRAIATRSLDAVSINSLAKVFNTAAAYQVSLNPRLVNAAGNRLLDESRENPNAWPAALALMSYRTTSNKELAAVSPSNCIEVPSGSGVTLYVSDSAFNGVHCAQALDHIAWTNVVFENVTVVYHGGSTVLTNVQFKNCQFNLDYSPASLELAKLLTASNSVTISLPGNLR